MLAIFVRRALDWTVAGRPVPALAAQSLTISQWRDVHGAARPCFGFNDLASRQAYSKNPWFAILLAMTRIDPLHVFIAVVDQKSFTRAAELMG